MTDFRTRQITSALRTGNQTGGTLRAGSVLQERYSIMGILGVGGMGAVYKARDMRFPNVLKLVAVKEMINLAPDPSLRQMVVRNFEREANLLATLNHPSIPKIYDILHTDNQERSYLVMEYIEGKDLEAILNDTPDFLPENQVLVWAVQLCDVLTYVHSHNPEPIVFRDMKPSNVMIDEHENVRLIDFGIAKGFQVGQKGTMIGTEGYSPPEQYRGEAGPAGDLYALGATLHHILTKRDPRLEPPFSFSERPIYKFNKAVSSEFEVVINMALAYNTTDRYPSAKVMKDALISVRNGSASPASTGTLHHTALLTNPLSPTDRLSMPIAIPVPQPVSPDLRAPVASTPTFSNAPVIAPVAASIIPNWIFNCEDEIRGQALVTNKYVFVGVYDNNIYALSRADGKFVWKFAAEGGFAASPVVDGQNIFIGSEDGKLYALQSETGRQVWTYETESPIRCTARISQGHVFFGSDDSHLHAVNVQNGRQAWKFEAVAPIRSRPAISERESRVFFGCEAGEFYGLDFSGSMKWRFRAKRGITSSPAIVDGLVVFGSTDASVYGLESSSGWAVWKARTNKPIVSSPAVSEKAAYIGSSDGNMYAMDLRSGKVLWRFETGDQVASSPAIYKNNIYFGSVDGFVYCVDIKNGKLRWKFQTEGPVISSPTIIDDVLYIGSTDKNLYALPV